MFFQRRKRTFPSSFSVVFSRSFGAPSMGWLLPVGVTPAISVPEPGVFRSFIPSAMSYTVLMRGSIRM